MAQSFAADCTERELRLAFIPSVPVSRVWRRMNPNFPCRSWHAPNAPTLSDHAHYVTQQPMGAAGAVVPGAGGQLGALRVAGIVVVRSFCAAVLVVAKRRLVAEHSDLLCSLCIADALVGKHQAKQ